MKKSEENSTIINGFYKVQIEDEVKKAYNEGLNFSTLNYLQTDSMACGLWACRNTFEGKQTKKEHTYTARVGNNKLYKNGQAVLFYLAIDSKTIYWDEAGEDAFLKVGGK